MVADAELSAAGDTRTPRGADGSGARAQKTAGPAALGPSAGARVASSAWRGRGTAGSHHWPLLATSAPSSPPGPQSERCQERQVGRHLPAARRTGREASPPAPERPGNQFGPEAGNTRDKSLGQRKDLLTSPASASKWGKKNGGETTWAPEEAIIAFILSCKSSVLAGNRE
ncbi:hypothetical protein NN561_017791 [Cricetulus griseus]